MAHPSLETLVQRIKDDAIGGAADMARESAAALRDLARDTVGPDATALAKEIEVAIDRILDVSPSIAPVSRVLHLAGRALEEGRALDPRQLRDRVVEAMLGFVRWLDDALARIERIGGELIEDGETIFTYSISSTVFRMIEAARRQGKKVSVITTESRPDNEGLTTLPHMQSMGVPVIVGVDAAVAYLLRRATVVYVGADTVLSTGASLCKVGSLPTALAARHHGVPFRVTADTSKFDAATLWGHPLVIRPTLASKILPAAPPPGVTVCSPVFEVVPPELIACLVTEEGIFHPGSISALFRDIPQSELVAAKLAARRPS